MINYEQEHYLKSLITKEVSEEDYLKIKEILEKSKADIIDNIIKNTLKR